MPRHSVHINGLSRAQAEYLAGAVEADINDLIHEADKEAARKVLSKIERALDKAERACRGADCRCRKTPSDERSDARFRASLEARVNEDGPR